MGNRCFSGRFRGREISQPCPSFVNEKREPKPPLLIDRIIARLPFAVDQVTRYPCLLDQAATVQLGTRLIGLLCPFFDSIRVRSAHQTE